MSAFLLHLLRHGEPVLAGRLLGRTDCAPLPGGIEVCMQRGTGLAVERIVSSDLHRAREAAEVLAASRSLPVSVDARWRELDFGDWDGLASADVDAEALGRFWADPDADPPPGGERWSSLVARVEQAIDALAPVPTLVVTHGGAMRAALAALCGFDQPRLWAFELPYAALLSLRVWPGTPSTAQIVRLAA